MPLPKPTIGSIGTLASDGTAKSKYMDRVSAVARGEGFQARSLLVQTSSLQHRDSIFGHPEISCPAKTEERHSHVEGLSAWALVS